jgi:hypothetical protein
MAIFFNDFKHRREPIGRPGDCADDRQISIALDYERRARTQRVGIFDGNVINDSSWPLVQELFAAHLEGQKMRTKQLCATVGLPQTTVLRYLDHLEKCCVIRREGDPKDSRVTLVSLTPSGAFWMREYYTLVLKTEENLAIRKRGMFALRAIGSSKALGGV